MFYAHASEDNPIDKQNRRDGNDFDSSQRSWIIWCPGALSFWVAL